MNLQKNHYLSNIDQPGSGSFYSPIGMSDLSLNDLTKEEQTEEEYYDEFLRQKLLK